MATLPGQGLNRPIGQRSRQLGNRERQLLRGLIDPENNAQQGQKRQQATSQRVHEELLGGISTLFTTPDADQEKQRDQRELEEHIEQNNIPSTEHAEATEFQHQQHGVKQGGSVFDGLPAYQNRSQHQDAGQCEQPDAQPVQSDTELNIDPRHTAEPRNRELEEPVRCVTVGGERGRQNHGGTQRQQRHQQRQAAYGGTTCWSHQRHAGRADQRQQQRDEQ